MDIEYLLFLQDLRAASGGIFDEFFNGLSKFAVDIMMFLPFVIFWGVCKKWGYRFFATLWTGELVNGFIKLTVCAYRPWIRSDLIEPAGDSKVAATGYSFPSGHSMVAGTMYGTSAVSQWHKRRWLSVVCLILILLTGFSRNFLGVHTPQDVAVGLTEALVIILIVGYLQKKLSGNEKLLDILSLIGIIAVVFVLVYIQVKPYPMDYVDGQLLVDPASMQKGSFEAAGLFAGLALGWLCERRFVRFATDGIAVKERIARGIVGVAVVGVIYVATDIVFKAIMPYIWAKLFAYLLLTFAALFVVPLTFAAIHKRFG